MMGEKPFRGAAWRFPPRLTFSDQRLRVADPPTYSIQPSKALGEQFLDRGRPNGCR